jgi:plasmid stabilization system protein ParE
MKIRLLDVARQELDEAIEYYNAESAGVGDAFLLEVLSAFSRIRQFPQAWHPYTPNSRRCQTKISVWSRLSDSRI